MVKTSNTDSRTARYRLELLVPPVHHLALADLLMSRADVEGFFHYEIQGYSRRSGSMTTKEQVAGRKSLELFVLYCEQPWQLVKELMQTLAEGTGQQLEMRHAISLLCPTPDYAQSQENLRLT